MQKQVLQTHFKMACLSYKPNPITLKNGIRFERNDVFGMQENTIK